MVGAPRRAEDLSRRSVVTRVRPHVGPALVFLAFQGAAAVWFARLGDAVPNPRGTWDGGAYRQIAENGYPSLDGIDDPAVAFYAFHPLFALVARAVSAGFGISTTTAAAGVSLACATVAILLLSMWCRPRLGAAAVYAMVLGLALWPPFPVLQMAYTEGMAFLLLVVALRTLSERRYPVFMAAVLALALTRPLAAPVAVVAVMHVVMRWRAGDPTPRLRLAASAAVFAGASTLVWPVLVSVLVGDSGGYLAAHRAFTRVGSPPSLLAGTFEEPILGVAALLVITGAVWIAARFLPRATPWEMKAWMVVYPTYVMGAALISTSIMRYLLLLFPVGLVLEPALRNPRLRAWCLGLLVPTAVLASAWWIPEFVPPVVDGSVP